MAQLAQNKVCTAFDQERGAPHRCGHRGRCRRVIQKHKGRTVAKHWVCDDCAAAMKLPDHDCVIDERQRIREWRG